MLSLRNGSPVTGRKASGCRCAECCKWFRRARYPLALMEPIAETPPTTVLATESLQSEPQLILVNLLPFTVPLALCVAGFRAQRRLPWWGIGGAAFVAAIAFFDIDRVPGYAAIEFGLAAAGLLISVASFAGLFRNP